MAMMWMIMMVLDRMNVSAVMMMAMMTTTMMVRLTRRQNVRRLASLASADYSCSDGDDIGDDGGDDDRSDDDGGDDDDDEDDGDTRSMHNFTLVDNTSCGGEADYQCAPEGQTLVPKPVHESNNYTSGKTGLAIRSRLASPGFASSRQRIRRTGPRLASMLRTLLILFVT